MINFDKVVDPRHSRVLRGKEDIAKMLREAGGLMVEPEGGSAATQQTPETPAIDSAEEGKPADESVTKEDAADSVSKQDAALESPSPPAPAQETPTTTPQPAKPAATPASPLDRLSELEQAIGLEVSADGMMDRLKRLEGAVMSADYTAAGPVPERIANLETTMGL